MYYTAYYIILYIISLYLLFRDELRRHCVLRKFFLTIDIEDVASFDETLAEKLRKTPTDHLPLVFLIYFTEYK